VNEFQSRAGWRALRWCTVACLAAALVGCGSSADVEGKVSAGGQPVKGGTLVFSPVGGGSEPAVTQIQPEGTFKLPSGTPPGRYKVAFTPPQQQLTDQQRTDPKYKAPPPLYMNMVPNPAEVEVKTGTNTIELQLVPRK
jgi:hypothetical protein